MDATLIRWYKKAVRAITSYGKSQTKKKYILGS
jgi:hypothetical protein